MMTIYIEEAHAIDVWPVGEGLNIKKPLTQEDRRSVADRFVRETGHPIPVYCDVVGEDRFEKEYAAWPTRFYIIYQEKMSYIATPKNSTFELDELRSNLEKILSP